MNQIPNPPAEGGNPAPNQMVQHADDAWPPTPGEPDTAKADFAKTLYQARVTDYLSQRRDTVNGAVAKLTAETELRSSIQAAYIDVMKGGIDRSIKRAEYLSAAAGAIATSYVGLLGLIFSAKDRPLVGWAIAPSLFLAASLVLAVLYVAFVRPARFKDDGDLLTTGIEANVAEMRLRRFLRWVSGGASARSWALRASVVSLGIGVAIMPLPFVSLDDWQREVILLGAGLAVLASPAIDLIAGVVAVGAWIVGKVRHLPKIPDEWIPKPYVGP